MNIFNSYSAKTELGLKKHQRSTRKQQGNENICLFRYKTITCIFWTSNRHDCLQIFCRKKKYSRKKLLILSIDAEENFLLFTVEAWKCHLSTHWENVKSHLRDLSKHILKNMSVKLFKGLLRITANLNWCSLTFLNQ